MQFKLALAQDFQITSHHLPALIPSAIPCTFFPVLVIIILINKKLQNIIIKQKRGKKKRLTVALKVLTYLLNANVEFESESGQ